jgi:hypothetical protein
MSRGNLFLIGVVMKTVSFLLLVVLSNICHAQINIEYLKDVPADFKEKYYSHKRDYNPLQVGNTWQYYYADNNEYWTTTVVKDSIINGKQYFKKVYYEVDPPTRNFITWERNDTISGVSFMLDFEDVNMNGDYLEELPVDSLENPYWSRYNTYKYSFNDPFLWSGEKTVLVEDTSWVIIEGDTVISRYFEILELFWGETIVDRFGIISNWSESPLRYCTGAIVNGKKYGTIVSVEKANDEKPSDYKLENNYPNPFNPQTTIEYKIKKADHVTFKVYDLLGKEIVVLIDEYKNAGDYKIEFNANQLRLTSGAYFYVLKAGSYTAVKKMILIK